MEIIRQLKEAGIFDLQRELALPRFAQRIAVVSSAQAAGYGDFCHQIDDNSYGLSFSHELFAAIMQGEQVEQSVIAALDRINARIDEFDVVVIIRGGGATTDMSGFDTLALAENVANFPLPIITGIGHDRDECILDMVSYMRVKTPTAAAAFLIDHLSEVYTALVSARERISRIAERHLAYEKMRLKQLADRIPTLFALTRERQTKRVRRPRPQAGQRRNPTLGARAPQAAARGPTRPSPRPHTHPAPGLQHHAAQRSCPAQWR